MKELQVIILKGLPGSGKSTYCKEIVAKEPSKWKHINKDSLREMIDYSKWSRENEQFVDTIQYYILRRALLGGYNVLFDNCNMRSDIFKQITKIAQEVMLIEAETIDSINVIEQILDTSLNDCIERDSKRTGIACVGKDVIVNMYNRYVAGNKNFSKPKQEKITNKQFTANDIQESPKLDLPPAIIVDIDGTIAEPTNRPFFDASKCEQDKPIQTVIDLVSIYHSFGTKIFFLSGREEKDREPTENWLKKYVPAVKYELFLRNTGDKTSDDIIKKEIYYKNIYPFYTVKFVIDDRPRVCRMFRESCGLLVLQLGHREF